MTHESASIHSIDIVYYNLSPIRPFEYDGLER
jgi:hypothetical protein